ncbi:heme-dependent oxidative N-demethylase subunit alpha family protein [Pseudorhodoferax sp.]|uniref:heme-dependent oxidative N-demethylase subunit alpha family protein n=1 Tax=Pseudorhodoferax sp. TaxID=1993553 RepID=UPI002DD65E6F|nr:heme-dependent oxidative N-demethylase subunit alpha family protein [Pseudorhodoferax sp.]
MNFDFDAAVTAPFRMQPGLRRRAPGAPALTPLAAGSRHQREKLAVLSAFATQALLQAPGFDAGPALATLCSTAAAEHPQHWQWDGRSATATRLGVRVHLADGRVEQTAGGVFGLGDELPRCVALQPPAWRLATLLALTFAEDLAIVDATSARIPWLAVALPSHWAPEDKVGRPFAEVHAPVADGELLRRAGEGLVALVCGSERWERFVWTVTDHPRLHAHPQRVPHERWAQPALATWAEGLPRAWFRSEHQTFVPVPGQRQAVFTIGVEVQTLPQAVCSRARALRLAEAVASMSPAVLAYRGLTPVRDALLQWLAARAAALAGAQAP